MATQDTDRAEFPGIFAAPLPLETAPPQLSANARYELAITGPELHTIHNALLCAATGMEDTADEVSETAGEEHATQFRALGHKYRALSQQTKRIIENATREQQAQKAAPPEKPAVRPRREDSIDEAIAVAQDLGAERTLLTHLTHETGHAELAAKLPRGIEPGYDGLTVEIR